MGKIMDPFNLMGTQASAPASRSYGGEISNNLQQQMNIAPELFGAESNPSYGQPAYAGLSATNLNAYLNGINGSPGYLSTFSNSIAPAMTAAGTAATSATRAANLQDMSSLGPGAVQSLKALNPDVASLYGKLAQQAGEGLDAGSMMTADQQRGVNNSVRSAQSARGMAYGPAASYSEVLANSQYGDQLLQQRQGFAGQVADMGNSLYSQPLLQYFGLGSNAPMGAAGNVMASGNSGADTALSASNTVGQLGSYASSLNRNNQQMQWNSGLNNAQQQKDMWASAGNSFNSILGGLMI